MDIIKEAEVWLMDNGILPSSVKYSLYTQKQVLKYPQAVAILGVGKNKQGEDIGFAIEVAQGYGVVYGGILEPYGIASWGKRGLMRTITENKLLVDVMQEMAQEHRVTVENSQYVTEPETTYQEPPKPQKPTSRRHIHPSVVSDEYDTEDEVESFGNSTLYYLLWGVWGIGILSQFFIKITYDFSGSTVLFIWMIGFAVAITAVILKREKFFSLLHIGFMLFVPFSFVFWLSVFFGFIHGNDTAKLTTNTQTKITFNQAINDIQSKGVANMYQTQTHQNVVKQTHQYLGNNPSDEKLQAYLQKMVDDTNPNLPIMVEQNVRADSMHRFGKILMHYFTITDIQSATGTYFDESVVRELKMELMTSANICKNNGYILKYGVSLSFTYYAINKDKLFDVLITPKDCGY